MRYGKTSATFLIMGGLTFVCLMLLRPGWGNPLAALGGLLVMLSFPLAMIFGVIGIINDRPRTLAIVTTAVSGGAVLFYMLMMGVFAFCR